MLLPAGGALDRPAQKTAAGAAERPAPGDAYPHAEPLTVSVIHRETGSPCEIAGSLVGGVPWEERARYRLRQKRLYICIIAVLAAVSVLTSVYALYMRATGGTTVITLTHYESSENYDSPPENEKFTVIEAYE